ncbi:hypothetical protein M426DRAFT_249122 [Hypoxylon sp. CI-4A]|nr:hypothetical protein M426DRAFT_249122 [Hypoxylon sp. CI-4A]
MPTTFHCQRSNGLYFLGPLGGHTIWLSYWLSIRHVNERNPKTPSNSPSAFFFPIFYFLLLIKSTCTS